jgi:MoaA/NifB/PqqE/SkfB family radical SAM enzyme
MLLESRLAARMLRLVDPRILGRMAWHCGIGSMAAIEGFKRRCRRGGPQFPPFLFISVTSACNLRCQGCWVYQPTPPRHLPPETLDQLIRAGRRQGSRFFGILGGEPLLYPRLWEVLGRHRDCFFQVFTNGTLLRDGHARTMRRLGNVTPLVSVEGLAQVSDERRGGRRVFDRTLRGIEACVRHGVPVGVASSICATNHADLVSDAFVRRVLDLGAAYLWYYIYRPVGDCPRPDLALTREQVLALRRFLVEARTRYPLLLVDAYWDADGNALCPAAVGISHHVSPTGDLEPCPPVQFATETVGDGRDVVRRVTRSPLLTAFRAEVPRLTRGCVLLDAPQEFAALVRRVGARDSSGRGGDGGGLACMSRCAGHHLPGEEIPERSRFYRFAKRHWFFGFGAYG